MSETEAEVMLRSRRVTIDSLRRDLLLLKEREKAIYAELDQLGDEVDVLTAAAGPEFYDEVRAFAAGNERLLRAVDVAERDYALRHQTADREVLGRQEER